MLIRVWMRTAARRNVTAFGTLFSTLCHEFCHHLDSQRFGWCDSPHTRGFYERSGHFTTMREARRRSGYAGSECWASVGGSTGGGRIAVADLPGSWSLRRDRDRRFSPRRISRLPTMRSWHDAPLTVPIPIGQMTTSIAHATSFPVVIEKLCKALRDFSSATSKPRGHRHESLPIRSRFPRGACALVRGAN